MAVSTFLFYLFSTVLLGSAVCVVTARNMVHSVLFLILVFLNAAGLFVLSHAEFLAMILIIVYVGAVAVLFLFVIMMLGGGSSDDTSSPSRLYKRVGLLIGAIFAAELLFIALNWQSSPEVFGLTAAPQDKLLNVEALGNLLYTDYIFVFQSAGLVLLIALIGSVLLTLRHREDVRRQKIKAQIARKPKESLRLVEIPHAKS